MHSQILLSALKISGDLQSRTQSFSLAIYPDLQTQAVLAALGLALSWHASHLKLVSENIWLAFEQTQAVFAVLAVLPVGHCLQTLLYLA